MRSEVQLFLGPPSKPDSSLEGGFQSYRIGAIAQLGERLICIQEAVGSTPSGSTILLSIRTKEVYPFPEHLMLRDICHRKGKIDPATRLVDLQGFRACLLQPITCLQQCRHAKGQSARNQQNSLTEICVSWSVLRFPLHMDFMRSSVKRASGGCLGGKRR